jgi:type I restriction enzyme, S subunit
VNMSALQEEKIGNLVSRVSTWNPSRDASNEIIRYVDLSSVDNETKSIIDCQKILGNDAPSRARQLAAANDILVSTVRPNLNGVARVPIELDGATVSTGFCVLRPDPNRVYPNYLFQWIKSTSFVECPSRNMLNQ